MILIWWYVVCSTWWYQFCGNIWYLYNYTIFANHIGIRHTIGLFSPSTTGILCKMVSFQSKIHLCIADIMLAISAKLTPLHSPSSPPSNESNSMSVVLLFAVLANLSMLFIPHLTHIANKWANKTTSVTEVLERWFWLISRRGGWWIQWCWYNGDT